MRCTTVKRPDLMALTKSVGRTFAQRQWLFLLACCLPLVSQANGISMVTEGPGSLDSGAGSQFSSSQINLTLPLEKKGNRREKVQTYLHLDRTEFKWEGVTAAQGEYYWLSMPLKYQQIRNKNTEFHINVEPGLMTDLNALDTKALTANIDIVGRRYRRSGSFWQLGIISDRRFGDAKIRPQAAVSWAATKQTQILLGFPQTLVNTSWSRELSSFLHIRPAGGVWREELKGQTKTFSVNYRNWRAGFGGEFHWRKSMWLRAEIGQLRARTIEASDTAAAKQKGRPGDDNYWQVGIRIQM